MEHHVSGVLASSSSLWLRRRHSAECSQGGVHTISATRAFVRSIDARPEKGVALSLCQSCPKKVVLLNLSFGHPWVFVSPLLVSGLPSCLSSARLWVSVSPPLAPSSLAFSLALRWFLFPCTIIEPFLSRRFFIASFSLLLRPFLMTAPS